MRTLGWLLFFAVLVAAILLEGRRQRRKYGGSQGTALMRAGMLELQNLLEPERRVEFLQEEPEVDERAESGDGKRDALSGLAKLGRPALSSSAAPEARTTADKLIRPPGNSDDAS